MRKGKSKQPDYESNTALLQELVEHFREKRDALRQQWVQQMTAKGLLAGLSQEEIENESITIYDTCIVCLETGEYEGAETYAMRMAERGVLRGAETVIVGIQPDVAFSMVQLGLKLEGVETALDLEEGLAFLDRQIKGDSMRGQ